MTYKRRIEPGSAGTRLNALPTKLPLLSMREARKSEKRVELMALRTWDHSSMTFRRLAAMRESSRHNVCFNTISQTLCDG